MLEDLKKNNKLKTILAIVVILVLYFFRGVLPGVHQTDQTQLSGDVRYPEFYKVVGKANISSQDKKLRKGDIKYDGYDRLNRTLAAHGYLTYNNIKRGQDARADISKIKPSGWVSNGRVSVKYANGKSYNGTFYNRSHLIAHTLGGDDKGYNLITGTRAQNVGTGDGDEGMQYPESLAKKYLTQNKKGSLYYIATPIYQGDELVPREVTVDILSDDGSINQHIIVNNDMPGYRIDYATGTYAPVGR